jgi:phosphoribosyl 1,2-cyclic phosphodiesterase
MDIKFWGVRGSIPCPGSATIRYGGNTACLELNLKSIERRIIIDAGSGSRELGNKMMAEFAGKAIQAEIFLTHTHWDHIMGFPFFTPIYIPSSQFTIYGPITYEEEPLKEVRSGQWTYRYFPVRHEDLSSNINYVHLKEGEYDLGRGLLLKTKYLNHPLLCLGYRFEFEDKVFCTAYDTEPFINLFACDTSDPAYDPDFVAQGEQAAREENEQVEKFFEGADLLVYDSQYTEKEYRNNRIGWGHSPIEHAIESASRNKVKRLALFHHDIQRTDADMDELASLYSSKSGSMEVFFAQEGMQIEL